MRLTNSNTLLFSYSDYFGKTISVLKEIIRVENNNNDYFGDMINNSKQLLSGKIAPKAMSDNEINEYKQLNIKYKLLVSKLLSIRHSFSK